MAVVETIKIEGDASDFNDALKELNTRIEGLERELNKANSEIKEFGQKGEKAIKGVKDEVKDTGKGLKDLVKTVAGLGFVSKLGDAATEAFSGSQKAVDGMNYALFTVQFAIAGLIDWLTGAKGLSEAFSGVFDDASELIRLQKESQRAEVRRVETQFLYQKLAEEQRQIRDDERVSLTERIAANENINAILQEQLEIERGMVNTKIAQAQAEYNRLPNIENEVALAQARVELLDIEERIIGQRSEYLSNDLALSRELLEIDQIRTERRIQEAQSAIELFNIDADGWIQNAYSKLQTQQRIEREIYDLQMESFDRQMALYDVDSVAYQQLLSDKSAADFEYALKLREQGNQIMEFEREISTAKFAIAQDSFKAIGELSAAFAGEDEASKKAQFEFQKKLSLASAIVSGIEAVQNAYKTAQASPYAAINPAYPTIQAGLAAAFSAAQVAAIARSKFESSTASSITSSTTAPSQPAQFNIVGQSGTNQLVEGIAGQFDKPIRAYVVSGEVISGAELDRRRLRTATFP